MVGRDLKMKLLRFRTGTERKVRVLTDTPHPFVSSGNQIMCTAKNGFYYPFSIFQLYILFIIFFNFIIYKNFLQCLKRKVLYYQK